jgi:hypothetical protein
VYINKLGENCALLRNNPEERSSHLLRGGSLKLPNITTGVRKKMVGLENKCVENDKDGQENLSRN